MASNSTSFSKTCAYIGLVLAAGLVLLNFILSFLEADLEKLEYVLQVVKVVSLALAIGISAYEFAAAKRKPVWMIIFWIALVIFIAFDMYRIFNV